MDDHEHDFEAADDEYRNRVIYCRKCGEVRPLVLTVEAQAEEDGFSAN